MSRATEVLTLGETMALLSPLDESVASGSSYALSFGGAESNVAIGLARLGHRATWVSALGHDAFGDMIHREVTAQGVSVIASRDPDRPTGLMVKSPSVGEDRLVRYYRAGSAASALRWEALEHSLISDARILHLTGITPALSEGSRELAVRALQLASEAGVTVSFDINYRPALWSEAAASAALAPMMPYCDIVFGSPPELALVVGEPGSPEHLARRVSERGPRTVVVKDAGRGASMLEQGAWTHQPAFPVEVVDTVGAGDGFVAGFLSEELRQSAAETRLSTGVITGALCCTHPGDWEGFPLREQLESLREVATR